MDISEFDKDQLAEYALKDFNVKLELRKSIDKLRDEVSKLQEQKPAVADAPVSGNTSQTHIKNLDTGFWFPANDMLKSHLSNWAYCDEDGNEA